MLLWGLFQMGARSEVWIRFPSLLSLLAALWLLYWLARRLFDREVALDACLVFTCLQYVISAAVEARPYGLAVLSTVAAMAALVVWIESGKWWIGAVYGFAAAATLHWHYFFGLTLLIHLSWIILAGRTRPIPIRQLVGIVILLIALTTPAFPGLRTGLADSGLYTHRSRPELAQLVQALLPASVLLAFGLACGAGRILDGKLEFRRIVRNGAAVRAVMIWAALPPAILFVIAEITGVAFFEPRYHLAAAPALAILFSLGLNTLSSERTRLIALVLLVVFQLKTLTGVRAVWPRHSTENWRGAMTAVRQITAREDTILLRSGLPEAGSLRWLEDARRRGMLLSLASAYPVPGRLIPTPYRMDAASEEYLENLVNGQLIGLRRFVFITREGGALPIRGWLQGRLRQYGYAWRSLGDFGDVEAYVVERL